MKGQSWYPAAALSAIILGCGGSTDGGHGGLASGGGTGIDGGTPSATGAQPNVFYGMRPSGGTSAVIDTGHAGTGGIDVAHSTMGGMGTGGFPGLGGMITMYGPRFRQARFECGWHGW